jgi:hypothetical protein
VVLGGDEFQAPVEGIHEALQGCLAGVACAAFDAADVGLGDTGQVGELSLRMPETSPCT